MAGSGDSRFILVTADGKYVKRGGELTDNPNEAFHGNIYHIGGRFSSHPIRSMMESTGYTGDKEGLQLASFTNWPTESSKRENDIWATNELGYSEHTYLTITKEDLYISNHKDEEDED